MSRTTLDSEIDSISDDDLEWNYYFGKYAIIESEIMQADGGKMKNKQALLKLDRIPMSLWQTKNILRIVSLEKKALAIGIVQDAIIVWIDIIFLRRFLFFILL